MKKHLNVLFISSWFPTRDKPTNGNFVESHAKASSYYNNVNVIHVSISEINSKYEIEERSSGLVQIKNLYFKTAKSGIKKINNLINYYRYIKYYNKLFIELPQKPDIVHASVTYPIGIIAIFLNYKYGVKFVLTEHWTIYQKENRDKISFWKKILFKWIAREASVIMPVSQQLANMMKETGLSGKYEVVPNTIDNQTFNYFPQKKSKIFEWIHISTLSEEAKNPKGMLRVYKRILTVFPNIHFKIISDTDFIPYKIYAKEIGISEDKITFLGTQTPEQIAQHLMQSYAFILFSNFENLPLVIIESFACGIPVVSTNVGGISEHFPQYAGILIPKGNEDALFQAMLEIMNSYDKYQGAIISDYAKNKFSYNAIGKIFSNIYQIVLKTEI